MRLKQGQQVWQRGRASRFVGRRPCYDKPEGQGGSGAASDVAKADDIQDPKALAAENAKLKADLAALGPRVAKFEEAEAKREAAAKKADEDKRKKELGVEKVLEEKDAALKTTAEKLASYEKREAARVDTLYAQLPEAAQQAIEPLKAKLDLVDWGELVEKQATLLGKGSTEGEGVSTFIKPGSNASRNAHEPSPKTKEILEAIGKGDSMAGKLEVHRMVDPDSGARVTKFTRHIRAWLKDAQVTKPFRLGVKQ